LPLSVKSLANFSRHRYPPDVTAEVAILNRNAVALAADSAGSVPTQNGYKIFASMDKIFPLSRHAPVAVMIYGGSVITGTMPWEIAIKAYRKKLGRSRFNTLKEYADDFFTFINDSKDLLIGDFENGYIVYRMSMLLSRLADQTSEACDKVTAGNGKQTSSRDLRKALSLQVLEWTSALNSDNYKDNVEITKEMISSKLKEVSSEFDSLVEKHFSSFKLSKTNKSELVDLMGLVYKKSFYSDNQSGIVFAGYGENQYFPSVLSYKTEGTLNGIVIRSEDVSVTIGSPISASVVPFAQQEMVNAFLSGTDQSLIDESINYIESSISQVVDMSMEAAAAIEGKSAGDFSLIKEALEPVKANLLKGYRQQVTQFSWRNFAQPVLDVVGILPKDELGAMAESLVNLTSFKRRVSTDAETVAGPIDVAVISKGDGLVWIRRKHYFDRDINHQFFSNYLEEE